MTDALRENFHEHTGTPLPTGGVNTSSENATFCERNCSSPETPSKTLSPLLTPRQAKKFIHGHFKFVKSWFCNMSSQFYEMWHIHFSTNLADWAVRLIISTNLGSHKRPVSDRAKTAITYATLVLNSRLMKHTKWRAYRLNVVTTWNALFFFVNLQVCEEFSNRVGEKPRWKNENVKTTQFLCWPVVLGKDV